MEDASMGHHLVGAFDQIIAVFKAELPVPVGMNVLIDFCESHVPSPDLLVRRVSSYGLRDHRDESGIAGGQTIPRGLIMAEGSIHERIRAAASAAPLAMSFPGGTAAACGEWQAMFRGELRELLQEPPPPERWQVVSEAEVDCNDHVREELVLVGEGDDPVPLHVLRPADGVGPWPAVLCVHGHGRMTMLLAAMAPEVKVAVISGTLNVMQQHVMGQYGYGFLLALTWTWPVTAHHPMVPGSPLNGPTMSLVIQPP